MFPLAILARICYNKSTKRRDFILKGGMEYE